MSQAQALDWHEWRATCADRLLLAEGDLLSYPKPPVLVDDLLLAGTLVALVSKPGMGKSFIALDLALSIASAQTSFVGLPLRVRGPVVYVVGEGAGRFKLRLKAWKHHHSVDTPLGFHWTNGPINLLDDEEVDRFVDALRELRPALVVVDTLSRCLVGADENTQQAMTQAVAALDRIRTAVSNLTVIVLHHLNAAGNRERGSTVLRGALDTQLWLKTQSKGDDDGADDLRSDTLRLCVDKQKDLDEIKPVTLQKVEITIPDEYEEGGRPSKSIVWVRPDNSLPLADRILAFVRTSPGANKSAIGRAVGGKASSVGVAITDLADSGQLKIEPHGKKEQRVYPVAA